MGGTFATIVVKVKIPNGVTPEQMGNYIKTAVCLWRKGGDPDSAIFNMKDRDFSAKLTQVEYDDVRKRYRGIINDVALRIRKPQNKTSRRLVRSPT